VNYVTLLAYITVSVRSDILPQLQQHSFRDGLHSSSAYVNEQIE